MRSPGIESVVRWHSDSHRISRDTKLCLYMKLPFSLMSVKKCAVYPLISCLFQHSIIREPFSFILRRGSCWTYAQRDLDALGPYLSAHINFFLSVAFAEPRGPKGPLCACFCAVEPPEFSRSWHNSACAKPCLVPTDPLAIWPVPMS